MDISDGRDDAYLNVPRKFKASALPASHEIPCSMASFTKVTECM